MGDVQWLTVAATVARALVALRNQPIIARGPGLAQVNGPVVDNSNLYQVTDSNGNPGWEVRDVNFVTGAPNSQVPGSAVTPFSALWVPVLAVRAGFLTTATYMLQFSAHTSHEVCT